MSVTAAGERAHRRRRPLLFWGGLAAGTALVATGFVIGYQLLYRAFYSPEAFVLHYVSLLAEHRAADALAIPGVAVDATVLDAHRIPPDASDALLRSDALGQITDVRVTGTRTHGDITEVTVSYRAQGRAAKSTYEIASNGWSGLAPSWRFAETPLSMVDLRVSGSDTFGINGFSLDKRQVSPRGADADLDASVQLLVFTPGAYAVSVETSVAESHDTTVIADAPLTPLSVNVTSQPTTEFTTVVQERVDEFLKACATQQVLQPTGCPFAYPIQNRIDGLPTWSIGMLPQVKVLPRGNDWVIPRASGIARITLKEVSIFDGRVTEVEEDVPFLITGTIKVVGGKASISIAAPDID